MKRFSVAFVAISGCILGPACQAIVGIGDRVEASSDVADGGDAVAPDGDGGSPDDADAHLEPSKDCPPGCLPPAPTGWSGPSATYDGTESGKPADCPPGYVNKELTVHNGNVLAAPATCDCGQGEVRNYSCTASVVTWNQLGCPGLGAKQGSATTSTCFGFPDMGQSFKVMPAVLNEGTCDYPLAKFGTEPHEYENTQIACGQAQASVCAGKAECISAPAPASPFTRMCIHMDGNVPCTTEDYKVRILAFKDFADTRQCSGCTGTPSGGSCASTYGIRADTASCAAPFLKNKTAGTCYDHPGMGAGVDIGGMGPTPGTCTLTGGKATGDVKLTVPVTFCCNH